MYAVVMDTMSAWVESLFAAWNHHDLDRLCGFYSPDYEGLDASRPGVGVHGRDEMRRLATEYWRAFPDLRLDLDTMIVQGDEVATFWWARGTHSAAVLNIPATWRRVEVYGAARLTVEAGCIHRAVYLWDVAGLLRSLGLLPDL